MTPRLDRRLVLEAASRMPDGAGGAMETWVELGVLWAEVAPGAGSEAAGELAGLSVLPLRITVRAAPAGSLARPQPGQRFREGARLYRVQAVAEAGALYLTCFAREEVTT